ncbi:hypothetical protein EDD15DRAFT_2306403 [Pisolithus albus]|nr:hypothetical protein EDD15DRAFT_2306403 [Pisolithus albus]
MYSFHKVSQRSCRSPAPFAEFCFLCPEGHWYTSQDDWKCHGESHLMNLDSLPYQCDPFIYANTLAAPGLCFWCLGNENFPPTFLEKASWQSHIQRGHLAESTGCKLPPARVRRALVRWRSLRTETSIFATFAAGSPGRRSSVVVPARRR